MNPIDQAYIAVFSLMIFSAILWLSLYFSNRRRIDNDPEPSRHPSVTFLVPAYNEEEHVAGTIQSLLDQDYPEDRLKVIAINDGSEDDTLDEMKKFGDNDRVEIIDKENTGKASSINQALERVDTELVGCMDGDSFPEKDMVRNMVGYFEDSDVKGVTPALKVKDPSNWIQKVIWAEYIYQIFLRKLFAIFDTQYVMPGPGSIYNTEYLKELGGWDEETLTEDMEIAFRMFKEGAKMENSTNAYVDTISPPTFRGLFRQRIRWYKGYLNNFLKYREMLFNRQYGNMGIFLMPFNVLWTAVVMFMVTHLFVKTGLRIFESIQTYLLVGFIPPSLFLSVQSLSMFHFFYLLVTTVGVITLILSVKTAGEDLEPWKRKTHYILFLWLYAILFAGFWAAALVEKIKGGQNRW